MSIWERLKAKQPIMFNRRRGRQHINCDTVDLEELKQTVKSLENRLTNLENKFTKYFDMMLITRRGKEEETSCSPEQQ